MQNSPMDILADPPLELLAEIRAGGNSLPRLERRSEKPWKQMSMEDLWSPTSSQESDTKGEPL